MVTSQMELRTALGSHKIIKWALEPQEGHKDLSICLSLWWPYNGVLLDSMMQGTSLDSPNWCKVELPISGVSLLITRPPQHSQKEASFTSSFCSNAIYLQFLSALFSGLYTFLLRRTHPVDQSINYKIEIPILVTRNWIQTSVEKSLKQSTNLLRIFIWFCNTTSPTH